MKVDKNQRKSWLSGLFMNQLMALAAMYNIKDYMVKPRRELTEELSNIEGVEIPRKA
jgi:hypothetical protein